MSIIDISPLLSSILGLLLAIFILFKRSGIGKNLKLRFALVALVLIITYICYDYYLYLNKGIDDLFWGSVLFTHLIGFLFYYIIALFTDNRVNLKVWLPIIISYTALRYLSYIPYYDFKTVNDAIQHLTDKHSLFYIITALEYTTTHLVNITFIILAYFKLRNAQQYAILDNKQEFHYKWIKTLFILFILLLIGTLTNGISALCDFSTYELHIKYESILYSIFFFALIFSIIQFPVFAFTGSFNDLRTRKYQKSSLTNSTELFQQIDEIVRKEELYLQHDLKLNTIAELLNTSIHHISQAINETAQKSFPDYINQYRINLAKEKLMADQPDTIFAIAIDVGFNSKANFYYAFKKITGTTPTKFKEEARSS